MIRACEVEPALGQRGVHARVVLDEGDRVVDGRATVVAGVALGVVVAEPASRRPVVVYRIPPGKLGRYEPGPFRVQATGRGLGGRLQSRIIGPRASTAGDSADRGRGLGVMLLRHADHPIRTHIRIHLAKQQ